MKPACDLIDHMMGMLVGIELELYIVLIIISVVIFLTERGEP